MESTERIGEKKDDGVSRILKHPDLSKASIVSPPQCPTGQVHLEGFYFLVMRALCAPTITAVVFHKAKVFKEKQQQL